MQGDTFEKDLADIEAVMREYIDAHPSQAPYHFPIDPSKSIATQATAAVVLSFEKDQTIILVYPGSPAPGTSERP